MEIRKNETFVCRGPADFSNSAITFKDGQIDRDFLEQQNLAEIGVPLTDLRVWDDISSLLPNTASNDDLAIITGTWGTDLPSIQTSDQASNGAAASQYAYFYYIIGDEFILGETLQFIFRAAMGTVADTTATLDLTVYINDGDGAAGVDLCSTAAQSINYAVANDYTFSITTSGLSHGDILQCRIDVEIEDGATSSGVIGEITDIICARDIRA